MKQSNRNKRLAARRKDFDTSKTISDTNAKTHSGRKAYHRPGSNNH